jgi:preprotein translocase subunit Sec61beta
MKTPEELYIKLDSAIDSFTSETISRETFLKIIEEINQNDFGIKIDPNLVPDNRESFNESGIVSFWEDDSSY